MADSYNELFGLGTHSEDASLEGWWKLQDNAASTTVVDSSSNGRTGTLVGGDNTSDLSATGPTGYFLKGLRFDGVADHVTIGARIAPAGNTSYLTRLHFDSLTTSQRWGGQNGNSSGDFILRLADTSGHLRLLRFVGGTSDIRFWDSSSITVGTSGWHSVAVLYDHANLRVRFVVDGVSELITSFSTGSTTQSNSDYFLGRWNTNYFDGDISDHSLFSSTLTEGEAVEWDAGPEPLNTVAPTLNDDGTGSVGTWDSQSNGTITYLTTLYLASDDSVIATSTAASFDFSGDITGGQTYYTITEASNDGGSDSAEDQTTADVVMAGGGSTYTLACDAGSFSFSGQTTSLTPSRLITATTGSVALNGVAVSLVVSRVLTCESGAIALAGQDADLLTNSAITTDAGAFATSGVDADLSVSRLLAAETGTITFVGQDADLSSSQATYTLTCSAGEIVASGVDSGLLTSRKLSANAGYNTLTGVDLSLIVSRVLAAASESLSITGQTVNLNYSGAIGNSVVNQYYHSLLGA